MTRPSSPRVLVVDSDFEFAVLIVEELAEQGFHAIAARSGRDALRRLWAESCDVLVTELRMPDVDGLALTRASRDLDPSRPVVVMTGYGAMVTALEAARVGAYHYLVKPFRLSTLVQIVGSSLGITGIRPSVAARDPQRFDGAHIGTHQERKSS